MTTKRFTREELYERVWTTPMVRLAKTFGLSDVGLAKICRKNNIPLPPPGYWAKVQAGKIPSRPKLPDDASSELIRLNELEPKQIDERPTIVIAVQDSLQQPHRLVRAAEKELRRCKENASGILELPESSGFKISVSRDQSLRALRIFDALFKYAETNGYGVDHGPSITILDETIRYSIMESLTDVQVEPSESQSLDGKYEFHHSRFEVKSVPSGKLTIFLSVEPNSAPNRVIRRWSEVNKKPLESQLGKLFEHLIKIAEYSNNFKKERQKQKELAEAGERIRKKQAIKWHNTMQAQKDEQSKLDELLGQVRAFRLSNEIREFVRAFVATKKSQLKDESSTHIDEWAAWALQHADRVDPTQLSPYSILDETMPDALRIWGFH